MMPVEPAVVKEAHIERMLRRVQNQPRQSSENRVSVDGRRTTQTKPEAVVEVFALTGKDPVAAVAAGAVMGVAPITAAHHAQFVAIQRDVSGVSRIHSDTILGRCPPCCKEKAQAGAPAGTFLTATVRPMPASYVFARAGFQSSPHGYSRCANPAAHCHSHSVGSRTLNASFALSHRQ